MHVLNVEDLLELAVTFFAPEAMAYCSLMAARSWWSSTSCSALLANSDARVTDVAKRPEPRPQALPIRRVLHAPKFAPSASPRAGHVSGQPASDERL